MPTNYDGLTRNIWPGTWSTGTNAPIALDTELRGTLQSISGASGDRLTDIPGARIQEGMLVYLKTGYTAGAVTRDSDTYFTYKLQGGESRSAITGAVPNAEANWSVVSFSGGGAGATGAVGASGVGTSGATGITGASGAAGATGVGTSGATGITGASGIIGASGVQGATGEIGASGAGVAPTTIFTTSSTNEVVVETIDTTLYRSAKYEMQVTHSTVYQASELRLLVDGPNVYLTQYGSIGESLGVFSTYYSPLSNNYSSPAINTGGLSVWNGTNIRFYTTDNTVQQALLSATVGTVLTLNGSVSTTLSSKFAETSSGIYDAATTTNKSPSLLISNVTWTGSGEVELRFKPNYAVNTLKYIRTTIET
jgi:hypothetical protein